MNIETKGISLSEGISEYPDHKLFEGVQIQWEKGKWTFNHPELGVIIKPTFSIYNPKHWEEIADLLDQGKTAAGMMMGNFGVFKKLDTPAAADNLFDKVKQRSKDQNFVALIHPDDMLDLIDISRIPEPYKTQLMKAEGRMKFYAGPQHVIFPAKSKVNQALLRQADQTIACFWVPEHFGFEGLVKTARKIMKKGDVLGGGSLNIHGKDPFYDKNSLKSAMSEQKEWLEEIDLIIFDDIAEDANIGRSHTMIRYAEGKPEIIRIGSLSPEHIKQKTGHDIQLGKEIRYAASKSAYSDKENIWVNETVIKALQRTRRFNLFLQELLDHR